jgi:hypothetical protein
VPFRILALPRVGPGLELTVVSRVLPMFPPDLVGPTLFAEKLVRQLDVWGMMRVRPSPGNLLEAVRIVALGQDPLTKEMLMRAEAPSRHTTPVGSEGIRPGGKNSEQPRGGKRPSRYTKEEWIGLLASEQDNLSRIGRKIGGYTAKAVRVQLQKHGLREPGPRTRRS